MIKIRFDEKGDFEAFTKAESLLKSNGFSVGSMQRDAPIGIMFGDYDISKWRNMSNSEIDELHGQINGDKRNGPVEITIFDKAPEEAKNAISKAESK